MNYTHINLLEITRFKTSTALQYQFLNRVNLLRDQSDDSFDLGRIGLSLYNQSILLTMEKLVRIEIKSVPVCRYN